MMKAYTLALTLLGILMIGQAGGAMWQDRFENPAEWSVTYLVDESEVGRGMVTADGGALRIPMDFRQANVNRLGRDFSLPRPRWISFRLKADGVNVDDLKLRLCLKSPDAPFSFFPKPIRTVDGWTEFEADINRPDSLVNVWRFYGLRRLSQLTLSIEKPEGNPTFDLHLTDLKFHYADERVESYTPTSIELRPTDPPSIALCLNRGGEYYGIEEILRERFPTAKVSVHWYRGTHLPLDNWPPDLGRVSLVVMVDADTYVLSDEELAGLADYVQSGGALLVFAGPGSVNGSLDGRPLASQMLPAEPGTSTRGRSESAVALSEAALTPTLSRCADAREREMGYPGPIQEVEVKPGSEVVVKDGDGRPVVVVGGFGKGKTALVTCWPDASVDKSKSLFWSPGYGPLVALLIEKISRLKAANVEAKITATRLFSIEFPYEKRVFQPNGRIAFTISGLPEGSKVRASLLDRTDRTVWKVDGASISGTLPDLADGEYILAVTSGNDVVSETIVIAPPLDKAAFYPIIARIPIQQAGHWFGPDTLRWMVLDAASHGANTIAVPVLDAIAKDPQGFAAESAAFLEMCTQEKGMGIQYDYAHLPTFAHQSRPPLDVRAPDATEKAERLAKPWTDAADLVPRLFAMKTIDEPTANYANLNLESDGGKEYREEVGFDVPDAEKEAALTGFDRLKHWLFVSDYGRRQFRLLHDSFRKQEKPWGLLHTFMEPGFGSEAPTKRFEDIYAWGGTADCLDFDIYPYWYPQSQKRRFAKVHYGFAIQRCVAQFYGKPMGFYVELDDRNWPFQKNPKEATGELAYTAVGEGCHYLNTFIYGIVGAGTMARPERWEDGSADLRAIAKTTPFLLETERARAQVALYFPYRQWIMRGAYYPTFGLELFRREFGECDIIHEEAALRRGFEPYRALILLNTDIIPAEIEDKLVEFVESGGVLILDHCPSQTPEGKPLSRLKHLVNAPENLDSVYRTAVENDDHETVRRLESWAHGILADHAVRPAARCSDDEFEASLLRGKGASALVVVNHRPESAESTVEVVGQDVGYVCDLATGKSYEFRRAGDSSVIPVRLTERQGIILGLYPRKPEIPEIGVRVEGGDLIVSLFEATGSPLPVFIEALDPNCRKSIRHSREILLRGRAEIRSRLAANGIPGRWRFRLTVPALAYESEKPVRL